MFARVTTAQGSPEQLETMNRYFVEEGIPGMQKLGGFRSATYLVDQKSAKIMMITFWESEEQFRENEATMNQMRAQSSQTVNLSQVQTEVYEVMKQV